MNSAPQSQTARRTAGWWVAIVSTLGFGAWWLGSIFLHSALFGLFYVAGPRATELPQADEFSMKISPGRVREVVEEIRERKREEFEDKIEEMAKIKQELDQINAQKIEQYNQIMQQEAGEAQARLTAAAGDAEQAQNEALQAQEDLGKALGALKDARDKARSGGDEQEKQAASQAAEDAAKQAAEAQKAVQLAQARAAAAQDRLSSQLDLIGNPAEAQTAHDAAVQAQNEAEAAQRSADGARGRIGETNRSAANAAEAARKETAAYEKVAAQLAEAEKTLASRKETLTAAETRQAEARTTAEADAATAAAAPPEEKKQQNAKARQSAEALKKEDRSVAQGSQAVKQSEAQVARLKESVEKQEKKRSDAVAAAEAKPAEVEEAYAKAAEQQKTAQAAQKKALELQTASSAAAVKSLAKPGAAQLSGAAVAATPTILPAPNPEEAKNLEELYQQAREAEQTVAETYKAVRAAELAALRKIPLTEALNLTEAATPDRAALDTGILKSDIATPQGVRAQEQVIENAAAQMDSMVGLARRMRELATSTGTTNLSVAAIRSQSERNDRMEQLAMEDSGMKAKDLTGEMAAAAGGQSAAQTSAITAAMQVWAANPINPLALGNLATALQMGAAGSKGLGASASGNGPHGQHGAGGGNQMAGYGENVRSETSMPGVVNIDPKDFRPIPGRTVKQGMVTVETGRQGAWMFVDSWYIIGPWPNPGRKNLHTKFPPETVVDLDAVYQGGRKDEQPLPVSWKFLQIPSSMAKGRSSMTGMVVPPGLKDFEIYYAYTELWFDQEADLWVAIGSDDQSKVWINDLLVWKSADYYKSWVPNEGLRKVHFRKGTNRILYRLENGQHSGGFSFMVCVAADPK